MTNESNDDDTFWLWDLAIETVAGDQPMICDHPVGTGFTVEGENIMKTQRLLGANTN